MKSWIRSFVVVAIMITILKPTTTGANSELCTTTSCMKKPVCHSGYETKWKTNRGCRTYRSKVCCCPSPLPQCIVTECDANPSCPQHYRALERTKNGCSVETAKVYCCKRTDLPICFAMDCPDQRVVNNTSCPGDYTEKGQYMGECGDERVVCCRSGFDNWNDGNQTFRYGGALSSDAEYFTIFSSNSQSLCGQFYNILLTLPIFTSIHKCTSISLW